MRYMDYDKFKKEYAEFQNWEYSDKLNKEIKDGPGERWLKIVDKYTDTVYNGNLTTSLDSKEIGPVDNDGNFYNPEAQNDLVNSPAHYTRGNQECIDTIEEAIQDAPEPIVGALQYQVLKYILRMWLKGNPLRDAEKARWYLDRLISKLTALEKK